MADFDLIDALHESTPSVEPEVKRDFIASLEAEKYDDVVGESVTKENYVPLLDDDETKSPSLSEAKANAVVHLYGKTLPEHDGGQLAERSGASEQGPGDVPNGEHGVGKADDTEIHKTPLGVELLSFGGNHYIEDTMMPSAQMSTEPPFSLLGTLEGPDAEDLLNFKSMLPPVCEMKSSTASCPTLQHLSSSAKVAEERSVEEKRSSELAPLPSEEMAPPQEQMLDISWQATDPMASVTAPLAFEEDLWANQEEVTISSTTLSPAEPESIAESTGNLMADVKLWEKEEVGPNLSLTPAQEHIQSTQDATEEFGVPFISPNQVETSFHPIDRCDPALSAGLMDDHLLVSDMMKTTVAVDALLQTSTKTSPRTPQLENLACGAGLNASTESVPPACGNFELSVGTMELNATSATSIAVPLTETPSLERIPGKGKLAEEVKETAQSMESPVVKVAVEKKKKKKKRSHPKGAQPPTVDIQAKAKEAQAIVSDQRLVELPKGETWEHKENIVSIEGACNEASGVQVKAQQVHSVPSQSSIWAPGSSVNEIAHPPLHKTKTPSVNQLGAVVGNQRREAAHADNQSQMEITSEVEQTGNPLDCWSREITSSESLQTSTLGEIVEPPLEQWAGKIIPPKSQKNSELNKVAPLIFLEFDGKEYTPLESEEVSKIKEMEGPYLQHLDRGPVSPGSKQTSEENEMAGHLGGEIAAPGSQTPLEVQEVALTPLTHGGGEDTSCDLQQTCEVKKVAETLVENVDRETSPFESMKVPEVKEIEKPSPEQTTPHCSGQKSGLKEMVESPLKPVDSEDTLPESNQIPEVKEIRQIPLDHVNSDTGSLRSKQISEVIVSAETPVEQVSTETTLDTSEIKGIVDIPLEHCCSEIATIEQMSEVKVLVESPLCWNRETSLPELQHKSEMKEMVESPLECRNREKSPSESWQTPELNEMVENPFECQNRETVPSESQQISEPNEMEESPLEYRNTQTVPPESQQMPKLDEMVESPFEWQSRETVPTELQQTSKVKEMVESPLECQDGLIFPECTDQITVPSLKHKVPKLMDDDEGIGSKASLKKEAGPKFLQKRGFTKGTSQREAGGKVSPEQHPKDRALKTSMQTKVMKIPNQQKKDAKPLETDTIGNVNKQSDDQGHLDESPRQDEAKPEEPSVEGMTGTESAVTSKERPLSTDTKGKAGTPATKITPTKSKPQPPASLKRPTAAATSPNKKLIGSSSATTAASTSKRVSSSNLMRPSSANTKDMKPKATEAKSPVKLPSTRPSSAGVTKTNSNTSVKSSTTSLQKMTPTTGSTQRNTTLSTPKRPTSIKTEPKSAEMKKSLSAKSPLGETGRPKTASSTTVKSTGTTPSAPSTPLGTSAPSMSSSNTSRAPRMMALKTTAASEAKRVAPIPRVPSKSTVTNAPKQPRPTSAPAPDLKNIKSKIGSTDNIKYQPGGGKAKPVEKRPEPVRLNRKIESSARVTKTTSMKDSPKQTNGKVQIVNKKIDYSHVQSKCGSKDNIKHVPGGGNVQIPKSKVDMSRASSKCGSKTNLKHKAGGGDVKIETTKTDFKNKAESKIGSLDNLNHTPGGGNVKIESRKLKFRENAKARTDHGADIVYKSPNVSDNTSPLCSTSLAESLSSLGSPQLSTLAEDLCAALAQQSY
ncbi:microtubule-associated protein 4-like isoform X2 [Scyliorhinus canicula]|uniref:microtubule-associated protein 4-like isoform X2 n=1 Tax=Scyliorhinus canicula TaxID=7830 RepID=UPI0018F42A27|nr:microtubule-associated protein 4-like isoform X2 [Scyliorhinus canicula]